MKIRNRNGRSHAAVKSLATPPDLRCSTTRLFLGRIRGKQLTRWINTIRHFPNVKSAENWQVLRGDQARYGVPDIAAFALPLDCFACARNDVERLPEAREFVIA